MQNAAIKHDIRFGEILLDAGANVNSIDDYLLEIAAYMSRTADKDSDVLDFVRLLIQRGATVSSLARRCSCDGGRVRVLLLFALAIAGKGEDLAELLIEKGAIVDTSGCSKVRKLLLRCLAKPSARLLRHNIYSYTVSCYFGKSRNYRTLALASPFTLNINFPRYYQTAFPRIVFGWRYDYSVKASGSREY